MEAAIAERAPQGHAIGAPQDAAAAAPPRHWLATAAIAGLVLALFAAFLRYGFNLDDEGTMLYQILRTARGERPYLDFHTGYTPAMFYLNAFVFHVFGVSALPVRALLALVNALAAALVFRLALRLAPPVEAACAAFAYALCMPFFAGQFAAFNIPYPAWYAVAAWLGAELASVRAVESGRRIFLLLAGVCCGVAFSFKPNTGLLCLGAAVLGQLLASPPTAGWIGLLVESALLAVAGLAVAAVLNFEIVSAKFALLGLPTVAMLASAIVSRARVRAAGGPEASRPFGAALADALSLLGGFLAATLGWLAYFLPRLGLDAFGREVLLLGAGVERIYGLDYPEPSVWALLAVAALGGAALLPGAIARGRIGRRGVLALALASAAGFAIALVRLAVAPEGLVISAAMQLENLSFYVVPLLLIGAVGAWLSASVRLSSERASWPTDARVWTVALLYALLLFVQLYPRIDFMHVVISLPSVLVIGAGALVGLERRFVLAFGFDPASGDRRSRRALAIARALAVAPIALGLLARAAPFAESRLDLRPLLRARRMTQLAAPALPVALERDRDHDLRELARVTDFVERETAPDDPILAFPALAIVPFVTGRATPIPHDYFFPGRPSHADEAAMLAQIARAAPPLVVALNDRLGYFSASPAYYFLLRDYVLRHYVLVRRFGRFDVLMRRDVVQARPDLLPIEKAGGPLSTAYARGGYRDQLRRAHALARRGTLAELGDSAGALADPDRQVRRARLLALVAVAERTPGGLAAVERAAAPNRAARLLFLRALGEFGDPSVLPYLRAVYASSIASDERVAREASTAINYVLARELAGRFAWTHEARPPLWNVPSGLLGDDLVEQLPDFDSRQRIGAFTALAAAAEGRSDLAGALEPVQHPRDTAWWRVIASYALVHLGRTEYLRAMVGPMEDGTLAEQYVPSLLLDPELIDPHATRALIEDLLCTGKPNEREMSAWMLPYLADPASAEALQAALADPDPAVRRAARWASEEIAARANAARAPLEGGS